MIKDGTEAGDSHLANVGAGGWVDKCDRGRGPSDLDVEQQLLVERVQRQSAHCLQLVVRVAGELNAR